MSIEISETAARKIRTLMSKQGIDEGGLRVGVKGGGCSGLSYTFAWEKEARFGDQVFEGPDGAKLFVDRKSLIYLNGLQQSQREDDLRLREFLRRLTTPPRVRQVLHHEFQHRHSPGSDLPHVRWRGAR